MNPRSTLLHAALAAALLISTTATRAQAPAPTDAAAIAAPSADAALPPYVAVQRAWEQARYATPEKQRVAALEAVAASARAAAVAHPDDAAVLTWEGIVLSSLAGEKGGLGALSLCKQARKVLLQAIERDPTALAGSAYTTLGSLYYQVPGWPVGFGDDDTAREMLDKALAMDPDGIDSNYFHGDFLREQGDYEAAIAAFEHALAAAPRPGRELADQGRRAEIEAALADARRHL